MKTRDCGEITTAINTPLLYYSSGSESFQPVSRFKRFLSTRGGKSSGKQFLPDMPTRYGTLSPSVITLEWSSIRSMSVGRAQRKGHSSSLPSRLHKQRSEDAPQSKEDTPQKAASPLRDTQPPPPSSLHTRRTPPPPPPALSPTQPSYQSHPLPPPSIISRREHSDSHNQSKHSHMSNFYTSDPVTFSHSQPATTDHTLHHNGHTSPSYTSTENSTHNRVSNGYVQMPSERKRSERKHSLGDREPFSTARERQLHDQGEGGLDTANGGEKPASLPRRSPYHRLSQPSMSHSHHRHDHHHNQPSRSHSQ